MRGRCREVVPNKLLVVPMGVSPVASLPPDSTRSLITDGLA
jgi:hypothetical protein